jgi:methylated-DNA-[protein]-cysteine S-methyltransferase
MSAWTHYESPLGPLTLIGGPEGLSNLYFRGRSGPLDEADHNPQLFTVSTQQLDEYFVGQRAAFDLDLNLGGTPFQRRVWQQLCAIPYGSTLSYSALARTIGRPDRVRAVAAAVGKTPTPIIIPCHRAVAANGDLTGYLGGLHRKRALLDFEAAISHQLPTLPAVWAARQITLN